LSLTSATKDYSAPDGAAERSNPTMSILSLQHVSKDYVADGEKIPALSDISLDVGEGEFMALVGRSGCGKSTLLNLAGAMDFPTVGTVDHFHVE
jgi:ABC-type lipoprotein export system ATPase subunit